MRDIPGKFIGIILAFFLCIITPFVNTVVEEEMLDRRSIVMETTNFIDEVVDSKQISSAQIKEFNTRLASYGVTCDYTITRYRRSVNPSVDGNAYVNYVPASDTTKWETGDRISVRIRTIGYTGTQTLAHRLTGMFIPELDRTFTARIR